MDIIDATRIKISYDNLTDKEYFKESLSVWYFTHELIVSEIEQVCAATNEISGTNRLAVFSFVFFLCMLSIPHDSPQKLVSHRLKVV